MKKILLLVVFISMLLPVFSLGQRVMKMPILYTDPSYCPPCRALEKILDSSQFPDWKNYIHIESTLSPSGSIPYLEDQWGRGISGVNAIATSITNYIQQKKQEKKIRSKKDIPPQPKTIQAPPVAIEPSVKKGFYTFCTFIEGKVTDSKTGIIYEGLYKCQYLDNDEVIRSFTAYHIPALSALGAVNKHFIIIYKPSSGEMEYRELLDDVSSKTLREKVMVLKRELNEEKKRLDMVAQIEKARRAGNEVVMKDLQDELTAMPVTAAQKRIIAELLSEETAKELKPVLPPVSQPQPSRQTPTISPYSRKPAFQQPLPPYHSSPLEYYPSSALPPWHQWSHPRPRSIDVSPWGSW